MEKLIVRNINDYFDEHSFIESLLISFAYNDKSSMFDIVLDYFDTNFSAGQRGFIKLIFHGVRNYKRLFGNAIYFRDNPNAFFSNSDEEVIVIQKMKIDRLSNGEYKLFADMNYNFGGIAFDFNEVTECKRIGVGKQVGPNEWKYIDIENHEEFSFEKPFG